MNSVLIWPENHIPKRSDLRYVYFPFFSWDKNLGKSDMAIMIGIYIPRAG
jgi:hypothetical protein